MGNSEEGLQNLRVTTIIIGEARKDKKHVIMHWELLVFCYKSFLPLHVVPPYLHKWIDAHMQLLSLESQLPN